MIPPTWPASYDRAAVRGSIEEASGESISVDDPLPDTLIATAQQLGMAPAELRVWIFDKPKYEWSGTALTEWAKRNGIGAERAEMHR